MATVQDHTLSDSTPTLIAQGVGGVHMQASPASDAATFDVFIGDSGVTTSTGHRLTVARGADIQFRLDSTDEVYVIRGSLAPGTTNNILRVLRHR